MIGRGYIRMMLLGIALLGCSSCRKELCYDHNHSANVSVNVAYNLDWYTHWEPGVSIDPDWEIEWSVVLPQEPEGVRLITYPNYEQVAGQTYNLPKYGGKLNMPVGSHNLMFYNNDTESVLFTGNGEQTKVTTHPRTRASYTKLHPDEVTMNTPDMLFAAYFRDLQIDEPDENSYNQIQKNLDVHLSPRVFSYVIRYEVKSGLEYVEQARGALSGMSGTVYLANGHTDDDPVTLLFDCYKKEWGCETVIRSFGVPGIKLYDVQGPKAVESAGNYTGRTNNHLLYDRNEANKVIEVNKKYEHRLTLEIYLTNGKTKRIELDVTDQVNSQPRGGVIVVSNLIIKPDDSDSDGGFDTSVDGWGDDQIIEVPID
ncbi:MAG: DUF5119 domain-containing protein [Bacteroidales bacterium]